MMISHQSWGDVAKWMGTSLASGLTHEVSRQEVPHCCLPAPLWCIWHLSPQPLVWLWPGSLAWDTEASCALWEVPSWEAGAAANVGYQHCSWHSWVPPLCCSPFFSPFSLPPDNLNSGDLIKMSTQLFFFLPFPHHAFNHRSLFREKYVLSQRHMWVWKSELSKAFLQVKKTANLFCDILSSSGDLCEAQGVLYIHLKLKQSWKTSKILQLLGGVGVNGQVHTKAKLSWVVFLSCFIIVKAGLGDRKLPRKRERRVGNGNSEASGFPGISPVAAPSCLVARFWQRFRSWVSVDCQASAVSHLRSG